MTDTDELDEGSINLYYTNGRVDARILNLLGQPLTLASITVGETPGMSIDENGKVVAPSYNGLTITTTTGGVLTIPSGVTLNAGTGGTLGSAAFTPSTNYATPASVAAAIAALVASSPAALDTLNELAAALGNDASFATTVTNALALKAPLASPSFTNFIKIANSARPSAPTGGGYVYFDATNRLTWIGTNNFTRTFDGTSNTADRIYVLPDAGGTVVLANNAVSFTGTNGTAFALPSASASLGYLEVPSNAQSAAYTAVLADSGKSIDHPATDANARTFTIPANASVAYPVGTCLTFTNMTSQAVTIAITTDTMYLAGAGTTGSRTLAQYGVATARKLTSTTWMIGGTNLT